MSRFVSGGTNDQPIERDEEWKKAQDEIESAHLAKLKQTELQGGKSLYEVLQANKAAKQDAFEESIRLKNQFRSLDEDEVDFLDKVLESTRAKEAEVKKETAEQLDAFRRQQEEAEKVAMTQQSSASPPAEAEHWGVGKKRKKGKEAEGIKGLKLRKTSSGAEASTVGPAISSQKSEVSGNFSTAQGTARHQPQDTKTAMASAPALGQTANQSNAPPPVSKAVGAKLSLGDYSSDEE